MTRSPSASATLAPQLERHRSWLRTVIAARVEDANTTDDLLQETLIAALRNAPQLKDDEKLAPWLYRIAVRQVLLQRRSLGRQRRLINGYADALVRVLQVNAASGEGNPQAWLQRQETIGQVRQALQALPKRDREVLALKYEQDWNYQQISTHLGLSREAVKFRLLRARKRLRLVLESKHSDTRPIN